MFAKDRIDDIYTLFLEYKMLCLSSGFAVFEKMSNPLYSDKSHSAPIIVQPPVGG